MAEFEIFFKESVWKDIKKIPKKDLRKILKKIENLSDEPRPPGCEKLTGQERYRLRQGRYRIVYSIQENELTVWIVKISHRKDIYR
ncbi:Plasmid stabilization system [Olavius algarvensis associated proteobacterium Delta 3]|nr:Plasmid stabilization system [Olavius algarvensis associated proteobacterium Delta 3]CAB5098856.1 Plasmid stabilization system [Olavius algarvensis associated proteobacterium Delta 3]